MHPLLLVLPLLQATSTDAATSAPAQPGGANRKWEMVSGIAIQAGDAIVTFRELEAAVIEEAEQRNIPQGDPARFDLVRQTIRRTVVAELEPQAGQDLGLPRDQIAYIVNLNLESKRRQSGGARFADEVLKGQTFVDKSDADELDLYRELWKVKVVGGEGIPGTRPVVDVYLRPGQLEAIYTLYRDQLNPPIIELQILWAQATAYGGEDAARESVEEAKLRADAGESFDELVLEYGTAEVESRGMQAPIPVPGIGIPAFREFAESAGIGEIGEPVRLELAGDVYWALARVHAKEVYDPPDYEARDVQTQLRGRLADLRQRRLLDRERGILAGSAYSWLAPELQPFQEPRDR